MDDAWDPQPYEPGDEGRLARLWTTVFGRPMSPARWLWKLKGRHAPVENVWVARLPSGETVGQYAGIPARLKLGGDLADAFVIVDLMTRPDFRRRGVLAALTERAHREWLRAGIDLVLGLPNERAQTRRADWEPCFPLALSRLVLRLDEVVSRPGRVPATIRPAAASVARLADLVRRPAWRREGEGGSVEIEGPDLDGFDWSTLDRLWASSASRYRNVQVRDGAWWRWRFSDDPERRYRLLRAIVGQEVTGVIAYRYDESGGAKHGTVAELFTAPDDAVSASALLRAAARDLAGGGCGTVMSLAAPGSVFDGHLRAAGFRPRPHSFDFKFVPLTERGRRLMSCDARDWHLTGADFDVL